MESTLASNNKWVYFESVLYIHYEILCIYKNDGKMQFAAPWTEPELLSEESPKMDRGRSHLFVLYRITGQDCTVLNGDAYISLNPRL